MSYPILVIEDDAELREAILVTLEDEGYQPVGVATPKQAVELAARIEFVVAVADVRIPEGDGIEVLRALKAQQPDLLCVVMTGFADLSAPTRALEVQVEDYLRKPFGGQDLLRVIERLERRAEERASYDGMFARVLDGFAPAGSMPAQPVVRDTLSEEARHSAFRSYYVGVRSGQLDAPTARWLWDLLESGEKLRQELAGSPNPALDGYLRLQEGYRTLRERIEKLKDTPLQERPRASGQTPAAQFDRFYHQLRGGHLSLELVKAAPTLRLADAVAILTDPELRALREQVWSGV